jgi:hypothetical protein
MSEFKRVVYIAPLIYTTRGHKMVNQAVKMACVEAATAFVPVYNVHANFVRQIVNAQPPLIITDWPDHPYRRDLLLLKAKLPNTTWWGLHMQTLHVIQSPIEPGLYDRTIAVEPGIDPAIVPRGTELVEAALLVNQQNIAPLTQSEIDDWYQLIYQLARGADRPTLLVMQSGDEQERAELLAAARLHVQQQDTPYVVIPSAMLPAPAARYMRVADRVYAATGYSTVWESVLMGTWPKTQFVHLDRKLEDLAARIRAAATIVSDPAAMEALRERPSLARLIDQFWKGRANATSTGSVDILAEGRSPTASDELGDEGGNPPDR